MSNIKKTTSAPPCAAIATIFAAIFTCTGTIIVAVSNPDLAKVFFESGLISTPTQTTLPNHVTPAPDEMTVNEIIQLREELDQIQSKIVILEDQTKNNPETTEIRSQLDKIDNRLLVIENAILDNPEKVLQLTLLRKDIDSLKLAVESTRAELDRLGSVMFFAIALLATVSVGLFALAYPNFQELIKARNMRAGGGDLIANKPDPSLSSDTLSDPNQEDTTPSR